MYKGPQRDRDLERKFSSRNNLETYICYAMMAAALIPIILIIFGWLT